MECGLRRVANALALAAMLALVVVPGLGRLRSAHPTATGASAHHVAGRPDAVPPALHADDCAYCALLGATALAASPRPAIAPAPRPDVAVAAATQEPGTLVTGLGARGPPRRG